MYPANIIENLNGLNIAMFVPSGFSPIDIAGLQLWLDANDSSTLFTDAAKTTAAGDGDVVGAWADKSGIGNDATQSTTSMKSTLQNGAINLLPAVRSDAVDDIMDISVGPLTTETIFIVAKHAVNNTNGILISIGGTDYLRWDSVVNSIRSRYNGANLSLVGGFTETDPNILRAIYDGVNGSLSINNGTPVTGARASVSHTYINVLARTGADPSNSDVAEMLVYDSALSLADYTSVHNYLKAKWGTP